MKEVPFSTVLKALGDPDRAFPSGYLGRFSDLAPADLDALLQIWPQVSTTRKHTLMKHLVERFEADTLLSFDELAARFLEDADGQVRIYALRLLSENADVRLLPRLLLMVFNDPEPASRAEAARLLGQFVRLGELEELPANKFDNVVKTLLSAAAHADGHVARAALEAVGYASSRPEVESWIEKAFAHHDPHWQASALSAAGHSADSARWQDEILASFSSEDQPVRLAAVQAAGELELKPARQLLLDLLEEEEDDEVLQAIIWSLSLIGGEDVRIYLQTLLDDTDEEDEEMLEFLEEALANLAFTEDLDGFDMLAVDEEEPLKPVKKK